MSLRHCLYLFLLTLPTALPAASQSESADSRAAIAAKFPEVAPEKIVPSPVPGLFEVRVGSKIAYVSADGRYLLQGEIVDLTTDENLTESRRESLRRDVLTEVGEAGMIVFSPPKPTTTITVFTDIDCGYCRKLHKQIADYNALGIKVRYMYFPRMGPGTESWTKAEQVACAKDRQTALTRSKLGVVLTDKPCQPNPVARHYEIGRDFGLQGTPAIVLESGELIGGYLDPAELSKYIAGTKVAKNQ
ncbi:MAG: DsbC family protein [Chromatiales bacterium]|jgi:thiol:disulfide interchange protein DsbC|nr:MAG: DsbC family protein [Chromatiales bacterium]